MRLTFEGATLGVIADQVQGFLADMQKETRQEVKETPAPKQEDKPIETPEPVEVPKAPESVLPTGLPTANTTPTYTQDQLAVALVGIRDAIGTDEVVKIIGSFGAKTLGDVPKDQYPALAQVIRNAGGSI